jgi:hypothetical protein
MIASLHGCMKEITNYKLQISKLVRRFLTGKSQNPMTKIPNQEQSLVWNLRFGFWSLLEIVKKL